MLRYVRYAFVALAITVGIAVMRVGLMIPFLKKKIQKSFMELGLLKEDEIEGCIFNTLMLKETIRQFKIDIFKKAQLGKNAPDAQLIPVRTLSDECSAMETVGITKELMTLWQLMESGVPLVVTFGSCSCPPFFRRLNTFGNLAFKFGHVANFVVIYIEEAHPVDGWFFKNKEVEISKHKTIEDRVMAAENLLSMLPSNVPVFADLMCNEANLAYGAFPERLYVLQNGRVEYVGGVGPFWYNFDEVEDWLETYVKSMDALNVNIKL